jgi:AcrR family transcriptional regulator
MSQAAVSTRRERRREARRQDILEKAAELFAEVGYEAATLEAVADRVDLAQASLYHYVRNKEDLLAQILVELIARIETSLDEAHLEDDPLLRLQTLCRLQVRTICTDPAGSLLARHSSIRERAEELAHTGGRYRKLIESIVSDGIEAGVFRPLDVEVFAWTLMLALNATTWWTPQHSQTPDEVADEILSYFIEGARARQTRG